MTEARQQLKEKRVEGKKEDREAALAEIPESEFLSTGGTETGQAHSTGSAQARGKPVGRVGGRGKTSNTANINEADRNETGSSGGQRRKGADKEEADGEEGIERLQSVTSELVKLNCGVLSEVLLERAKEGNLGSFKLLVALAERKKPREKPVKKARGLRQAQRLALEPQWQDGMPGGGATKRMTRTHNRRTERAAQGCTTQPWAIFAPPSGRIFPRVYAHLCQVSCGKKEKLYWLIFMSRGPNL
jgi:hypothetical protein